MRRWMILVIIGFFILAIVMSFYLSAMPLDVTDSSRSTSELPAVEKFRWVQHWDQLDLAAVKRHYQPYTLTEMREMWNQKLVVKYGGPEGLKHAIGEVGEVYPQDKYLARMLQLGRPFIDFSDYKDALTDQRIWLFSTRMYWNSMSTAEKAAYLERQGLPPDAT